ncbi:MAG: serine/threonine-protein kinase [Gemmataceae bacterium]
MKVGPYNLLEQLGAGAMGAVYRGVHASTGQYVAVKVLGGDLLAHPVLRRRFEQECAAVVRLEHPHLVKGIEFSLTGPQPYLVMELVDGPNLRHHVTTQGPLPARDVIRYGIQLADALEVAHQQRLLHRDVKPENVLLTREGHAKLTDLGLLKDLDAKEVLTRPGSWIGTISFMAPEQFGDSHTADPRCDVYGLGATLYHAVVGAPPFAGQGNMTTLGSKLRNEYQAPGRLVPGLPLTLDRLICQALRAEPEMRPGSMQELRGLLELAERELTGKLPEAPADRRVARRFPTLVPARCRILGGRDSWSATLQEVSLSGIRLEVARRFEPGTLLTIEIPEGGEVSARSWMAQVRWARPAVLKRWLLGCQFADQLSESELSNLLENKEKTVITTPRSSRPLK